MQSCKRIFYILVLVLALLVVPIGMGASLCFSTNICENDIGKSVLFCNANVGNGVSFVETENASGADGDYSDEEESVRNYLIACDNLNLRVSNYLDENAKTYMDTYLSTRETVLKKNPAYESETSYPEKLSNAKSKYNKLLQDKSYIVNYNDQGDKLLGISGVNQNNKSEVQKILDNYNASKNVLIANSLNGAIKQEYETSLATWVDKIASLRTPITRPSKNYTYSIDCGKTYIKDVNLEIQTFVYDGKPHYMTSQDSQTKTVAIMGYDENTMKFVSLKNDYGKTGAGIYSIIIEPKEDYEWETTETTEPIEFKFEIVKATYRYASYVTLFDKSVTFNNGEIYNLPLVLKDVEETRTLLKDDGYTYESRTINGTNYIVSLTNKEGKSVSIENLLTSQGVSIKYTYNDIEKTGVSDVGSYVVKVEFSDVDFDENATNFKNYNTIESVSANLVVCDVSVYCTDEQLVKKAILNVDGSKGGYITPESSLVVKEISMEDFPLDTSSVKYRRYIAENEEVVFSYDINVSGKVGGTLELRVLIPKEVKGNEFKMLHIHGNETYYDVDVVNYSIEGDYVVFEISNFSTFSFVCEKDMGLAWWAILLICFAILVVLLAGLYLTLFFIWKKNGTSKVKALIPYFESTYKALYKVEYKKNKELTGNDVKLLEDTKIDDKHVLDKNISIEQKEESLAIDEQIERDVVAEEKISQKTSIQKKTKAKTVAKRKVGRPRKEKVVTTPKKRGRPKKVETVVSAPKKRGRPRKVVENVKPKAKRGRPRKDSK